MDALELIARTAIFSGTSAGDLEPLRPALRNRTFAKNSYLFREGDPGSHLYVVVKGQVKISRIAENGSEVVFAIVGPGEMFGELGVFEEAGERTADAQALEAAECIVMGRDALVRFCLEHPPVMLRMISTLIGYIRRKDAAMAEAAFVDIPGRVALKLLELAASKGERAGAGTVIAMPLSQRTLAGMVGASRENVNRALNRFVELGYIKQERGTVTILKPSELRRRGTANV